MNESLIELYEKYRFVRKVSEVLNINRERLARELKAQGVTIPNKKRNIKSKDVLLMRQMYLNELKSLSQIAKEFGVGYKLVSKKLKEIGVGIRTNSPKKFPFEVYKEWAELYSLGFSYKYIAGQYGVNKETVRDYLQRKMNIPSHTSQKIFPEDTYCIWADLYLQGATLEDIGKQFAVSSSTVANIWSY